MIYCYRGFFYCGAIRARKLGFPRLRARRRRTKTALRPVERLETLACFLLLDRRLPHRRRGLPLRRGIRRSWQALASIACWCCDAVPAETLIVPQDYSTIQEAIDAAEEGDLVLRSEEHTSELQSREN